LEVQNLFILTAYYTDTLTRVITKHHQTFELWNMIPDMDTWTQIWNMNPDMDTWTQIC